MSSVVGLGERRRRRQDSLTQGGKEDFVFNAVQAVQVETNGVFRHGPEGLGDVTSIVTRGQTMQALGLMNQRHGMPLPSVNVKSVVGRML